MTRLAGKVAIVTGGASGIGAATARRFRADGAACVITDVQGDLGRRIAAELGAAFVEQDVADEAGWAQLIAQVERDHGRLDILMNNAGVTGGGSIEAVTLAAWRRTLDIDLTGVMLGCRAAIGLMRRNPGGPSGSIINVSSIAGLVGMGSDAAYTAAKGGVRLLTKSVAMHCARSGTRIRCNSIHPGAIDTPILAPALAATPDRDALWRHLENLSPFGRMGAGADIAAMAAFLASDDSAFVTGAELLVDGGMLAGVPGF